MLKSFRFLLPVVVLCILSPAQTPGEFGCSGRTRFFESADLRFAPLSNPEAIRRWESRPGTTFDGFDEQKLGFASAAIYDWRAPLQNKNRSAAGRLLIAVRLAGSRGERWFQIEPPSPAAKSPADKLLSIDRALNADEQPSDQDDKEDAMTIVSATPDPAVPIFMLAFDYQETANYASGTVSNHLLLDLRSGSPQIRKAVQCILWESAGVCGEPANLSAVSDNLRCNWDQAVSDFHCTMVKPFGPATAVRAAGRDFYLFSGNEARPDWYNSETPQDLGSLAQRLSRDPGLDVSSIMVPQAGPVTLLGRYTDLLPAAEVYVFASPGAGETPDAAFSLVVVPEQGSAMVQNIPAFNTSGQSIGGRGDLPGYTPASSGDTYRITPIEDRKGFHAFQAVMSVRLAAAGNGEQEPVNPVRVLYWIGVEEVQGKIVSSAVRLATEASKHGSCGQELHQSTAISVEPQSGMAAATVHIRPTDPPGQAQNTQTPVCVWVGALYWKQGGGFATRKTGEECDEPIPEISITEDGQITAKTAESPAQ